MTVKQKENRKRFKLVIAEAKKLRNKNPKLTQPQAVKQAWAIMYGKKVGAVKSKPTTKRKVAKEYHKDTKSHNVNIRVMSGVYENPNVGGSQMQGRISEIAYVKTNNNQFQKFLKDNANKWVDIDTKFLFNNQYNGSNLPYRFFDTMFDAIRNDKRKYDQFPGETVAFLDWNGIKPDIIVLPEKIFGSYTFSSIKSLNLYELRNARKTIRFLFYKNEYYVTNGIGYTKFKKIRGTYSGDTIPTNVQNQLHKYLLSNLG